MFFFEASATEGFFFGGGGLKVFTCADATALWHKDEE